MIFSLNIDHIATIRNARSSKYPSLTRASEIAKEAGAEIITIHLREDRRHIKDEDAIELCRSKILPINLEIGATEEMVQIALNLKPKFVCFVPENRKEITTEEGLDVVKEEETLIKYTKILQSSGIEVSFFIEPNIEMIKKAKNIGANTVEFHTGKFAESEYESELNRIKECAEFAKMQGLKVHAGHGLNFSSASKIVQIKDISTLHIGHFAITESIYIGLFNVVAKFVAILQK
jgi:pyridoxine 5-phosphate synthase